MKLQDIGFVITFLVILALRKERWFVYMGLGCFLCAIPLFSRWVFFTAERLTWYGSFFILAFLVLQVFFHSYRKIDM